MTERTATTIFRIFRRFNRSTSDNTGLELEVEAGAVTAGAVEDGGFLSDMTSPN
eukprot:CAMPEP_0170835122 /NCGR_PEP_ID=MMETSP0734-20130129/1368_1 /TAXON_ID=186038 /ORGANISM="Fragilariopsis kerguelensis, Strain L26-C5" /LENGTH=53 /DNA_ID=CAMNT_0011201827 /DNA_START=90 /DNA_END=248 /DNA_ORIENTATION=-